MIFLPKTILFTLCGILTVVKNKWRARSSLYTINLTHDGRREHYEHIIWVKLIKPFDLNEFIGF